MRLSGRILVCMKPEHVAELDAMAEELSDKFSRRVSKAEIVRKALREQFGIGKKKSKK